jgi:hypothetical protein
MKISSSKIHITLNLNISSFTWFPLIHSNMSSLIDTPGGSEVNLTNLRAESLRELVLQRNKEVSELRDFAETEKLSFESVLADKENECAVVTEVAKIVSEGSVNCNGDALLSRYIKDVSGCSTAGANSWKGGLAKATRDVTIIG